MLGRWHCSPLHSVDSCFPPGFPTQWTPVSHQPGITTAPHLCRRNVKADGGGVGRGEGGGGGDEGELKAVKALAAAAKGGGGEDKLGAAKGAANDAAGKAALAGRQPRRWRRITGCRGSGQS